MTLTPAQQKGFEIGKLYRVVSNRLSSHLCGGDVMRFTVDDGSIRPRFKLVERKTSSSLGVVGVEYWLYLDDLASYEQPTATKQKLTNQEFLLMYVKQYYPEDRVMIALVENL